MTLAGLMFFARRRVGRKMRTGVLLAKFIGLQSVRRLVLLGVICSSFLGETNLSHAADAGPSNRSFRWEIFAEGGYYTGDKATDKHDAANSIELGANGIGGIGGAFNLGPLLNLNIDIVGGPAKVKVKGYDNEGNYHNVTATDASLVKVMGHVEFYPINGPLTPLLTAGAGFIAHNGQQDNVDVNEVDFALDAGAGVRWDFDRHWFVKGVYRAIVTKFQNADDTLLLHSGFISVGFKF